MSRCAFHPAQAAVGVCVRCRRAICAGCRTRIDGINHCHACLRRLATPGGVPGREVSALPAFLAVLACCCWLLLVLLCWLFQGALAGSP